MCVVVHVLQLRIGELRVALRCGEALVAEQFLDRPQIRTFFKKMGAKRVT